MPKKYKIEKLTSEFLTDRAIYPNIKGFDYIVTAVQLVFEDRNLLRQVNNELYPKIAILHNDTCSKVERAIRHAINLMKENGYVKKSHTNGSFIAAVYLELKFKVK